MTSTQFLCYVWIFSVEKLFSDDSGSTWMHRHSVLTSVTSSLQFTETKKYPPFIPLSDFLQIVLKHQKAVAFSILALPKNVHHSVVTLNLLHYQNSVCKKQKNKVRTKLLILSKRTSVWSLVAKCSNNINIFLPSTNASNKPAVVNYAVVKMSNGLYCMTAMLKWIFILCESLFYYT